MLCLSMDNFPVSKLSHVFYGVYTEQHELSKRESSWILINGSSCTCAQYTYTHKHTCHHIYFREIHT